MDTHITPRRPPPAATRRLAGLLVIGLSVAAVAAPALADDKPGKAERRAAEIAAIRAAVARGELLPLPRIMALAQARVPGDVVKTELESEHGRLTYEVKVLTASGQVQEVKLDARNGTVLEVEND